MQMSPDKERLKRAIVPLLYRQRGEHRNLRLALDNMPVEALRELYRILDDMQRQITRAEHTFRPFPGGPKIRY